MEHINKNDQVKITDPALLPNTDLFKDYIATVLAVIDKTIEDDEGNNISLLRVKITTADGKNIIQEIPEDKLQLIDKSESKNEAVKKEQIQEQMNSKQTQIIDYIKPYVFSETIEEDAELIPSWIFIDKIAAAECIDAAKVADDAKKLGYKLYCISAPNFDKVIVLADGCSIDSVYSDYADYLYQPAFVEEL